MQCLSRARTEILSELWIFGRFLEYSPLWRATELKIGRTCGVHLEAQGPGGRVRFSFFCGTTVGAGSFLPVCAPGNGHGNEKCPAMCACTYTCACKEPRNCMDVCAYNHSRTSV